MIKKKYKGPLPSELQSLYHLTNGLEYIHSQKVVHRDIKPGNVLISLSLKEVLLKWSDFGFSKITSSDGNYSMSGLKGTSKYLAPEIIANENNINRTDQSHRILMTIMSDMFACGCAVFFQLLTKGIHPFGNEHQAYNISKSNPINLKGYIKFKVFKKGLVKLIFVCFFHCRTVVRTFCLPNDQKYAGEESERAPNMDRNSTKPKFASGKGRYLNKYSHLNIACHNYSTVLFFCVS